MKKPKLYPVSLNLQGKNCLVIGGGSVAEKRVLSLLACGASVRLISPAVTPTLARLAKRRSITWIQDIFRQEHLGYPDLVFGATDDRAANHSIYKLAKARNCLVNLADDPPHCDFHLPAMVRRGHLAIAVSTDGQSPAFAAWVAKSLERMLDRNLGRLLARYARLRPRMKVRYPDMHERAEAWQQVLDEESPKVLILGVQKRVGGRQKAVDGTQ